MKSTPSPKPSDSKTKAYYICGTHWDREWYEPFQEYRMWLVQNIDSILDRLQADPRYRVFHLDGQAVVLEDYLEIRPERRAEIRSLLADGRLVAGPWYAMPDLFLVSGEALIRNFTRGMRVVREMGATPMPIGYCPDLFGHICSMPMIFSGLGFEGAVVWRGLNDEQVRAQFVWVGPDGSKVITHRFPDNYGYGWFGGQLRHPWKDAGHDDSLLAKKAETVLAEEAGRSKVRLIYLSDGGDHQNMPDRVPEMLGVMGKACPDIEFVHGSMTEYFRELKGYEGDLEEFHGELRHVARVTGKWYHALIPHCLASRYPLKRANDRTQNLLTLWAEPMAALALAAGKPVAPGFLDTAWKHLLQNQPHDSIGGCSVDETHADMPYRFHQADLLGDGVRRQAMAGLSSASDKVADAAHVVVWNPLPWERREVAEIELIFPADFKGKGMRSGHQWPVVNQFDLIDTEGKTVPYQILEVTNGRFVKRPDAQGRRLLVGDNLDLYRVALPLDLPPSGHAGLTVRPLKGDGAMKRQLGTLRTAPLAAANKHLSLSVSPQGTAELTHLETGRVFRDLFQYEDTGDTGDGWNFVPPLKNSTLVGPGQQVGVFIEEDGPLQVTFRIDRVLRVSAALEPVQRESRGETMVDVPVSDYLTLKVDDPILHVRSVVDNTARDHRIRVMFPSDIAADEYDSDQPFAWLRRPVAIDAASAEYKEPDPVERPHHTVFAIGDSTGGLAVLCPEGLHEHSVLDDSRRTLALTLFRAVHKTVQTNGEPGSQTLGRMEFRYALSPFRGGLPKGQISRRVQELQAGIASHLTSNLPSRQSFCRIDAPDEVVMTALKPGMDGRSVVVRLWNTGANSASAVIRPATPVAAAWLCNLNEEPGAQLPLASEGVPVDVPPFGLATVSLTFAVGEANESTREGK
jgi:alpha-mannosidase/mannosylglycerate hydrolase